MIRCLILVARIALVMGMMKRAELNREAAAEREARFSGRSKWVV